MTAAREEILERIRRGLGRQAEDRVRAADVARRLADPPLHPMPGSATGERAALRRRFVEGAGRVGASVAQVRGPAEIPSAVAQYLARHNLPHEIRIADDQGLADIPWGSTPSLTVRTGGAVDGDLVSLTGAFAAIAETGTLMLLSGRQSPTTLNFLPDTHIVVVRARAVVGGYEEAWRRLRARGGEFMPRLVNWITGPSRTADIEQTILLGVHGPRRQHIILVNDEAP